MADKSARKWWALIAIAASVLVVGLDLTVLNLALPTIATDLHNPNSPVAKAVLGTANYFTAAICKMTGNQPASACTSTVQALESQL